MKKIIVMFLLSVSLAYGADDMASGIQEAYELFSVGSYDEAIPLFESSYEQLKRVKNSDELRLKAALYLGLSFRETADYVNAAIWFNNARAYGETVNLLAYIGESERLSGDFVKAIAAYEKAINYDELAPKDKAVLYYGLAESFRLAGSYNDALSACDKADEISENLALDKLILMCDITRGESFRMLGEYAKSMKIFGISLDKSRARGYPDISIAALNGLGLVSETLGKVDSARGSFEESLNLSLKIESYDNIEKIAGKISSLLPDKGDFSKQAAAIRELSFVAKECYVKVALRKLAADYYKTSGANDNAADLEALIIADGECGD